MGRGKSFQQNRFNKSLGMLNELGKQLVAKENEIKEKEQELNRLTVILSEKSMIVSEMNLVISKVTKLEHLKHLTSALDRKIEVQNLTLNKRRQVIHRKKQQISGLTFNILSESELSKASRCGFMLTKTVARKRKRNPTEENLSEDIKRHRRSETVAVGMTIHGATKNNMQPALNGLLDSIITSFPSKEVVNLLNNCKISDKLSKVVTKQWVQKYEKSDENILRSINVFYSSNVMGKAKYIDVRKANRNASLATVEPPNLIPYKKLASCINAIDIGNCIILLGSGSMSSKQDEVRQK